MKIAFISYWGLNEGLTQATVLPHVQLLRSMPGVERVMLFTIERSQQPLPYQEDHFPLYSRNFGLVFLDKVNDYLTFIPTIREVVRNAGVQLIISRSSLAGGIGLRVARSLGCRHATESFEPHEDYMLESGVWNKWDPRYQMARYFHRMQCAPDNFLIPVSEAYAALLRQAGVQEDRLAVVPCTVDPRIFRRQPNDGLAAQLGIGSAMTVGVYAGKFGGMYYREEAFEIFAAARKKFPKYFQLILTGDPAAEIRSGLIHAGFSTNEFAVLSVAHEAVADYLSLANFAFATYRPSPSKRYLSPIKVGEYWACGLPVLLTDGTGDDADIIKRENCGAVFQWNPESLNRALDEIKHQLASVDVVLRNQHLAHKYRSRDILVTAYQRLLNTV